MLRILAPVAALGLIAAPALAATSHKTTTHKVAKKPAKKAMKSDKTKAATTATQ